MSILEQDQLDASPGLRRRSYLAGGEFPPNYAVCQADLLIKNDRQATVRLGNSLIPHDPHSKEPGDQWPEPKWRFNRMLSNPPFGVTWGGKDGYEKEAIVTEPYEKAFTAANVKKEQDFHQSDMSFRVRTKVKGKEKTVEFTVKPKDNASKKFKEALADVEEMLSVEWTHRQYVQDDIPHGEDIEAFLKRETAAKYGRDYFEATGKKTTNLACTNATKVGEFSIPLPSLTEQEAICNYLNKKLGEIKRIISGIETQIATLTAYRKSLIHECVTGHRRITEMDLNRVKAHQA